MLILSEHSHVGRAGIYGELALRAEGIPHVRVRFVSPYVYGKMIPHAVDGSVFFEHGYYTITISDRLSIVDEVSAFAHELAHIKLGHVRTDSVTPEQVKETGKQIADALQVNDAAYMERERGVDALAWNMVKRWEEMGLRA